MCHKIKTYVSKFQDCLFNNKTVYRSQQKFKSGHHKMYTEVNKIALRSNDDKRLQTSDRITSNLYGTSEMMLINK